MNKQGKIVLSPDGRKIVVGGIEWLKWFNQDGSQRRGYTWNSVAGCHHDCQWKMPDGTIAVCYAKSVAERVAMKAYPHGFEHHYWHEDRLDEPLRVEVPARIFIDSMSDLFGHWVPRDQVQKVLDVCEKAHWHTFIVLTKNAPRLLQFKFPSNLHVGVSSPPDKFMDKWLSDDQYERMFKRQFDVLAQIEAKVKWVSFEPLSRDVSDLVKAQDTINWAVIGAATNGRKKYQPQKWHVQNLLNILDNKKVPVFFKGNLDWPEWRECYPVTN